MDSLSPHATRSQVIATLESELSKTVEKLWKDVKRLEGENRELKGSSSIISRINDPRLSPLPQVHDLSNLKLAEALTRIDRDQQRFEEERSLWDKQWAKAEREREAMDLEITELRKSEAVVVAENTSMKEELNKLKSRVADFDAEGKRREDELSSEHARQRKDWETELKEWQDRYSRLQVLFAKETADQVVGSLSAPRPIRRASQVVAVPDVETGEAEALKVRTVVRNKLYDAEQRAMAAEAKVKELESEVQKLRTILDVLEANGNQKKPTLGVATDLIDHSDPAHQSLQAIASAEDLAPSNHQPNNLEISQNLQNQIASLESWKSEAVSILELQRETVFELSKKYKKALLYADALQQKLRSDR